MGEVITLTDGRRVILYPFPLSTGQMASFEMPADQSLSAEDAERLAAFIRTLVE